MDNNIVKEKNNFILSNYIDCRTKCMAECKCCGHKFHTFPYKLVSSERRCRNCKISNKDNLNEYKNILKDLRRYKNTCLWCDKEGNVWSSSNGLKLGNKIIEDGYYRCSGYKVHKMVMWCWGERKPGDNFVIRHLNDIKTDNRIENLRWGLLKHNSSDMKYNEYARLQLIRKCKNILSEEELSILTRIHESEIKEIINS